DLSMVHRHIGGEGGPSGAVNHASVLNEQVICHDASSPRPRRLGAICHLGAYYSCPPCDAPAQVLLWTSVLYAIWEVRSRADIPPSGSTITTWWQRTTRRVRRLGKMACEDPMCYSMSRRSAGSSHRRGSGIAHSPRMALAR